MTTLTLRGLRFAAACICLTCAVAAADDNPLERAKTLRNDAAADWNKKDHTAAVKKLREALEIYARVDGEKPADRAITQRALIWNLVRAGLMTEIQKPFQTLMDIAVVEESVYPEVTSAFSALWEAASSRKTFEEAEALMTPIEQAAESRQLHKLRGQTLHSLGSLAVRHKASGLAIAYYTGAIDIRQEIGDAVGEAWSLNNLANLHLVGNALTEALDPLSRVYKLVHTERVPQPQQAVAWNLKKAIEMLHAKPDERAAPWLRALREASARSGYGAVVPPSFLDRQALLIAEKTNDKRAILALAKAILHQPPKASVPELQADLTIRAAVATARQGKSKRALLALKKLSIGTGPCAPHLSARAKTARALVQANKAGKANFPAAARDAAAAWRGLGDFGGRRAALASIVDAAEAAGISELIPAVVAEQAKARTDGVPGGAGGSATGGGDRSRAKDLPLDAPVFYVTMSDGQIRIEDRVAKHELKRAVRWKPAGLAINGLSLTLFGGYVVVKSLKYGGSSSAPAAAGATTLEALGIYMPIPAQGALVILKNGAVRYETTPVSPR